MPIPSLSSTAKPRSQIGRANSVSTWSDRREEVPADDHKNNAAVSSRLHKRSEFEQHEAKKRSFLPQRGLPKPIGKQAGAVVASEASQIRENSSLDSAHARNGPSQPRPRPRSLYQTRASQHETTPSTAGSAYSPRPLDSSMKPPGSVGLSRTQSLRRPGVPLQSEKAASMVRSHARTNSASTPSGNWKDTAESAKPTHRAERPKSIAVVPAHTRTSNNVPVETAPGVARTAARSDALKRQASTRSKIGSSHSRVTSTKANESADYQPTHEGRESVKAEFKKPARPAFSTLQQHFTPKKTSKAPTSTFLHTSEPTNTALPLETISLQNELLQLHMLHESSAMTMRQWESSAAQALQMKFDEVTTLYRTMQEKERYGQEQKNVSALREWNTSNSLSGPVEHIQALSGPLHELPSLLDPGGRFFNLIQDYTQWSSRSNDVWEDRSSPHEHKSALHTLEGLGELWRGEHAAMTRKLTAFARQLEYLPPAMAGSSIEYIVSKCQSLVEGLLGELHIMQATENEVVIREKRWVEERLRAIAQDTVDTQLEADSEAWRLY